MQKPHIHLNGDDPDRLAEEYYAAMEACHKAFEAVVKTHPHGRNYYPAGPDAQCAAIGEHCARLNKIQLVINELSTLAAHCWDQAAKREVRS